MKKQNLLTFFTITLAVVIAGCELEPPREFGDPCEDFSYIWTGGNDYVMRSSDIPPEYAVNFQIDMCPVNAPFCTCCLSSGFFSSQVPTA